MVAIPQAYGIGFLGPGAKPVDIEQDLKEAREFCTESEPLGKFVNSGIMPISVGIQTQAGDLIVASSLVNAYEPAAAWLLAPR